MEQERFGQIEAAMLGYKLDSRGLALLKRLRMSCPSCKGEESLLKMEGSVSLDEVQRLNPTGIAITLFSWMQEKGVTQAGPREVLLAFSSSSHARSVSEAAKDPHFLFLRAKEGIVINETNQDRYFFTDIANPVRITEISEGRVSAIYSNQNVGIKVQNIFPHGSDAKPGDLVIIHWGNIVMTLIEEEDRELVSEILTVQRNSEEIMERYKNLDRVDYDQDFGTSIREFNAAKWSSE